MLGVMVIIQMQWFDNSWGESGPEPSIRSRTLYIPLNIWSTLSSKMAIPLVSLYNIIIYI